MLDVVIRDGVIVDGTGSPPYCADVGICNGIITEIGRINSEAHRTLKADGALLTPGFIDIHTHYDGQASWDETFSPSIYHGVTTVVMGNCGVGFAPVVRGQEQRLIELMEGVEEIPGAVLAEGVRWGWSTFSEYTAQLDAQPHSIDYMTLVPHDCLRLVVMGERASRGEAATEQDIKTMQTLLRTALTAGAIGFSTGRTDNHRTSLGYETPASQADRSELLGLAQAFNGLSHRIVHAVSDFDCMRGNPAEQRQRFDAEYQLLEAVAQTTGQPLALTWLQRINAPEQWQWLAHAVEASKTRGLDIRLQTACRGIGVLNGLDTSFNVLMAFAGYQALLDLPLPQRAERLRDPAVKAQILSEVPVKLARDGSPIPPLVDQLLAQIDTAAALMFPLAAQAPNYEPPMNTSFAARAQIRGVRALEAIYDYLAEGDGSQLVYFPIFNYLQGNLNTVHTMLTHPQALLSLSDAGAHVGTVCDASFPTSLLAHWTRDRSRGQRLSLENAVHLLTARNAAHLGLADRGTIAVGLRADLNVIDYQTLQVGPPELVHDLPAGGKRFVQKAQGYLASIAGGQVICEAGTITSSRPGRWLRAM
jgi:N-acyl-D-aspartate/D-glutamate deacylase